MELSTAQQQRLRHYVKLADDRHGAQRRAAELVRELMDERRAAVEDLARIDRWIAQLRRGGASKAVMEDEQSKRDKAQRELDNLDRELAEARE